MVFNHDVVGNMGECLDHGQETDEDDVWTDENPDSLLTDSRSSQPELSVSQADTTPPEVDQHPQDGSEA